MSIHQPIRILLIDDESSVLFALRLLLEAMQYKVTDFLSAVQALEALNAHSEDFDLVLCDLKMPQMNGFEALKRVKSISPDLAFILMSAHASTADVEYAVGQGANGFLAKPFTPDQLKKVIVETCAEAAESAPSSQSLKSPPSQQRAS